jgi:hypothetical protein
MGRSIGLSNQQCKEEIVSPPGGNKYSLFSGYSRRTRVNMRFSQGLGVAHLLRHKDQVRDRLHEESYGSAALAVLVMALQSLAIDIVEQANAFAMKLSKAHCTCD